MLRRMLAIGLIVLGVAACGGSTATTVPSASAPPVEPTLTPTLAPSEQPTGPVPGSSVAMTAACNAIGVRKTPSTTGALLTRVSAGTTVHTVGVVTGDAYTVGACGTAGDTWLEIDEINGKTVQSLYGVPSAFSAAGLFK